VRPPVPRPATPPSDRVPLRPFTRPRLGTSIPSPCSTGPPEEKSRHSGPRLAVVAGQRPLVRAALGGPPGILGFQDQMQEQAGGEAVRTAPSSITILSSASDLRTCLSRPVGVRPPRTLLPGLEASKLRLNRGIAAITRSRGKRPSLNLLP